ncbi:hypothetical protein [Micromonospora sagamiensis]|uniref:Uncharacterized protein n=1 Tax=Micromonospora sagamiensis TaxID=47875 RepID=A0A562WPY8_9ACTN|nr:hypothetical protein [Micromonospora sagamiensis]TWJ32242.1 hypothetical protein JD81_05817 [Micromonospora sagamiensis]
MASTISACARPGLSWEARSAASSTSATVFAIRDFHHRRAKSAVMVSGSFSLVFAMIQVSAEARALIGETTSCRR